MEMGRQTFPSYLGPQCKCALPIPLFFCRLIRSISSPSWNSGGCWTSVGKLMWLKSSILTRGWSIGITSSCRFWATQVAPCLKLYQPPL